VTDGTVGTSRKVNSGSGPNFLLDLALWISHPPKPRVAWWARDAVIDDIGHDRDSGGKYWRAYQHPKTVVTHARKAMQRRLPDR